MEKTLSELEIKLSAKNCKALEKIKISNESCVCIQSVRSLNCGAGLFFNHPTITKLRLDTALGRLDMSTDGRYTYWGEQDETFEYTVRDTETGETAKRTFTVCIKETK